MGRVAVVQAMVVQAVAGRANRATTSNYELQFDHILSQP